MVLVLPEAFSLTKVHWTQLHDDDNDDADDDADDDFRCSSMPWDDFLTRGSGDGICVLTSPSHGDAFLEEEEGVSASPSQEANR